MPLITAPAPEPAPVPAVASIVPAQPGLSVSAYAPAGTDTTGIPTPSTVVAWAAVSDPASPGGVRIDPVFLADGRTWTPDQFRAAYGDLTLKVARA